MLGWKLFAVVNAVVVAFTIVRPEADLLANPLAMFGMLLSLPTALGLLLYAFGKTLLPSGFWNLLSLAWAGLSVFLLSTAVSALIKMPINAGGYLITGFGALAVVGARQFFRG